MVKSRRVVGSAGRVAHMREKVLVGKPKGKRPLRRCSRRWKDSIKKDLREIKWGGMDWVHLVRGKEQWRPFVNMVMNFRVP
jgi:hypothetical protein